MASYMRLGFARKSASLCSSIFNISQQRLYSSNYSTSFIKKSEVRPCFLFCLSLPLQCRNMSSTCTAELSSLSPKSLSLPFLHLPEEEEEVIDENANNNHTDIAVNIPLFSVAENKVMKLLNKRIPEDMYHDAHCSGSSHGWLAFVNGYKCDIYLANIFSPSVSPEIIQLPPIDTLPHVHRVSRDSSSNIVKKYHLRSIRGVYEYPKDGTTFFGVKNAYYSIYPHRMSLELIARFAMSSAPNNGNNNCTVMICFSEEQNLAFCRIGDTSWTILENSHKDGFTEIIFSKKDQLFYALTEHCALEAWDLHDPSSPKRIHNYGKVEESFDHLSDYEYELLDNFFTHYYLVESSGGDILYVIRYIALLGEDGTYGDTDELYYGNVNLPYRTVRFAIYKLEFEKGTMKTLPVTSIGDSVLFLGYNHSFSLSARDYPDLKPNSIYFADNHLIFKWCPRNDDYPCGGNDVGVYNIEDYSVTPLYHPFELKKILRAPIWVFPYNN